MSGSSPAHQQRVTPSAPVRSPSCTEASLSAAVALAALGGRLALLGRAAGAAHRDTVLLDDLARVGRAVLAALEPAARVSGASERVWVALLLVSAAVLLVGVGPLPGLLVQTSLGHKRVLPRRSAAKPPYGPDSAADAARVRPQAPVV